MMAQLQQLSHIFLGNLNPSPDGNGILFFALELARQKRYSGQREKAPQKN